MLSIRRLCPVQALQQDHRDFAAGGLAVDVPQPGNHFIPTLFLFRVTGRRQSLNGAGQVVQRHGRCPFRVSRSAPSPAFPGIVHPGTESGQVHPPVPKEQAQPFLLLAGPQAGFFCASPFQNSH